MWKADIENIIKDIFNIPISECVEDKNRILIIHNSLLIDITKEDNSISLGSIIIPKNQRNKGLAKKFVKELISYCKNNKYYSFKVESIIDESLNHICMLNNMEEIPFIKYDFDKDLYESETGEIICSREIKF